MDQNYNGPEFEDVQNQVMALEGELDTTIEHIMQSDNPKEAKRQLKMIITMIRLAMDYCVEEDDRYKELIEKMNDIETQLLLRLSSAGI